jgi:hypothetical protein
MTGDQSREQPMQTCSGCGRLELWLSHLDDGWKWPDRRSRPLCKFCLRKLERHLARFARDNGVRVDQLTR